MAAVQKIIVTLDPEAKHLLQRIATALEKQQNTTITIANPEQLAEGFKRYQEGATQS
jgi:hypothetical protein